MLIRPAPRAVEQGNPSSLGRAVGDLAIRGAGSLTLAALSLALISCAHRDDPGGSSATGPAAPAESVLVRSEAGTLSRVWIEIDSGLRARGTLRLPPDPAPRSLAVVVIAGGFENGWRAAELVDPGPGIALYSVDYPFEGPRRRIPVGEFLRRASDFWRATRAMDPLLREAGRYLARRPEVDSTRILVAGGSLGVPFALRAAVDDPRFRGVALLYGAADLGEWTARNLRGAPEWARPWIGRVVALLYRDYEPERLVGRVSPRPVLFVSGRYDERVPPDLALRLYRAAREPRELVWVEGGHVRLRDEELTRRLITIMLAWVRRHGFVRPADGGPRPRVTEALSARDGDRMVPGFLPGRPDSSGAAPSP